MADTEIVPPRRRRSSRLTAAAVVALAVIALAACSGDDSDGVIRLDRDNTDLTPPVDAIELPDPVAATGDIEFATFEGGTRSLAEFLGRPLVINFFASWCSPCVAEMPDLENVYQEVKSDVGFLGLAQDEVAADALDLVEQTGVSYDIGWDPDLDVYSEFGSFSMPTTVFVTAEGQIAEVFPGALTADAIREKVDALRS